MADLYIWIIFGALIILIVGFIFYKIISEKITARKEKKLLIEFKAEAKAYTQSLTISVNRLIELNEEELNNFEVSVGKMKMKDINFIPAEYLKDLMNLDKFKRFVLPNPEFATFVKNLNNLKEIKANSWVSKCSKELSFFKEQANKVKQDISDEAYQKEINFLNQYYAFEKRKIIERR
ncbi:FeoB-associated Cys-rich membrane protein [Mycoplasmopsis citelli]|uniref:Uncharacterized protein n=1 Tax=Mycoplasmopsis citelli TaxID=171281 RepID=A0A449B399_9BACT|nr:FeoB-associated Cys-rich membrane protein [Mycoplasmopsis citelli]UUD36401.1 FeoB-associated Cys-rich membrane protein [Mycoplasmopsis citelli]VEU75014.1 Uncharacterised protein [Mycoplasmopsis citelli]